MDLLQGEIIPNALGQNMKDYSIYAANRAGFVKTGQILHSASCPLVWWSKDSGGIKTPAEEQANTMQVEDIAS